MSGGHFNYDDRGLAHDIFGFAVAIDYNLEDEDNKESRKVVRRNDPFEDKEISELIYDVFCLIHSYDWAICGDTSIDQYRKDVKYFKDKWLNCPPDERVKREIDKCTDALKKELYTIFCEDYDNDDKGT